VSEQTDAILDGYKDTVRQYRERVAALEAERDARDADAKRYWMLLERREEQLAKAEAEVERLTKALELVEFAADDNETRLTEYIVKLERVVEAARRSRRRAHLARPDPLQHWAEDDDLDAALAALEEAKP